MPKTKPAHKAEHLITKDKRFVEMISPSGAEIPLGLGGNIGLVGDHFVKCFVPTKYPENPGVEWLSKLNLRGVTYKVACQKKDSAAYSNLVSDSIQGWEYIYNQSKVSPAEKADARRNAVRGYIDHKLLEDNNEAFFDAVIIFVVKAKTRKEVERRGKVLISACSAKGYTIQSPPFLADRLWRMAGPYGYQDSFIMDRFAFTIPGRTLAMAAPFTSSGINDVTGSLLGFSSSGGPVILDIWKFGFGIFADRTNANLTALGNSGGGKSTLLKLLLLYQIIAGVHALVTDPEGEFKDLIELLGGEYFNCGDGGGEIINPLEVFAKRFVVEDNESDEGKFMPLTRHLSFLKRFFALQIDAESWALDILEIEILRFYEKQGITVKCTDLTQVERWGTLSDLLKHVKTSFKSLDKRGKLVEAQRAHYARLIDALTSMSSGPRGEMWNGQTTIKLDSPLIGFGTNSLIDADASLQSAQYQVINQLKWGRIQENSKHSIKTIDLHDEAHLEIDPRVPATAANLFQTAKRIRKYNGALWTATQQSTDFLHPAIERIGRSIMSNATYKFIFAADGKEAETIADLYKFSSKEKDELQRVKTGKCELIAGNRRTILHILRPPEVIPYITTDDRERVKKASRKTPTDPRWKSTALKYDMREAA